MDYDTLLDREVQDYIAKSLSLHPADAAEQGPDAQRRAYDALCASFMQPRPENITVEDQSADTVPVRIYTAGQPTRTIVFFHGGGFVVGNLDSHDDICAELCLQSGYRVVAVDYRLSPEHAHPAAYEDALMATRWALTTFDVPVVLVGDSAGATLAATVAHSQRGATNQILGQVLIYPALGGDITTGSYLEHANAPMLTTQDVQYYMSVRHGGERVTDDVTAVPLADTDFSGLPPTVLFSADCDPLRDDAKDYSERIKVAGGQAHWINELGLVHGYLRARHSAEKARDSFERITIAVEALGQRIWPYA